MLKGVKGEKHLQPMVEQWQNNGRTMVKQWQNNGRTVVEQWQNSSRIVVEYSFTKAKMEGLNSATF